MPEAEIGDLIIEVRSATAGVGTFTFKFDHMAELTGRTADQIVAASERRSSGASDLARECRARFPIAVPLAIRDLPVMRAWPYLLQPIPEGSGHERHSPPRLGNSRTPGHARASVLQPPRASCRAARRRRRCCAGRRAGAARRPTNCPIRPPIFIRPSATRNTRSTGRSPTRRSTATTTISTNSDSTRTSPTQAQALQIRPWTIKIDGMVEKPMEIGIDDLIRKMTLEERTLSPPLRRGVEHGDRLDRVSRSPSSSNSRGRSASAKYVAHGDLPRSEAVAPGQKQPWFPWPYVEGLTMAEATNELAFLATGAYGHPMAKQHGAPLRLAVPWKYGFKSIKSIVRFTFTDKRPSGMWEELQPSEYGFWANVNPEVPHPRWSQASEEVIGTGERRPTLLFNGYGEYVAGLYKGLEQEPLWM